MPAVVELSKDRIVKVAVKMVNESGWDSVNARSLAACLGVSTKPLYRIYESMDEIKEDIYKEIGPLGGIYSSLLNCKEEYLFITACDMPFITKKNIKELCDNIDKDIDIAVFCDKDERLYPLCAIYSKKVIPIIEEMIKQKNYKLSYLIDKSNFVKINIEDTDIELETLSNINTPQEYDSLKNKI